ncbi:ZN526 protein, partial [Oceanites oceanicus]|nr:ZN526 protein [Oceanites oceanicus]
YRCLDCGRLLLSPTDLLAHQNQHPRGDGAPVRSQRGEYRTLFPSPTFCHQRPRDPRAENVAETSPDPYECSECGRLLPTPEELLEHQGEHFTATEKENAGTPPTPDPP